MSTATSVPSRSRTSGRATHTVRLRRLAMAWCALGWLGSAVALAVGGAAYEPLLAAVGVASLSVLVAGPIVNRADERRPWQLLAFACLLLVAGMWQRAVVLGAARDPTMSPGVAATLTTLTGYLVLLLAVVGFIHTRRAHDRSSATDALLVVAGTFAPVVVLLVLPAMARPNDSLVESIAVGLFPLIDVLLLHLLARLAFGTGHRLVAMRMLVLAAALLLIGDVMWALAAIGELSASTTLLDAPFAFALVAAAAAALHPDMRSVTTPRMRGPERLRRGRLLLIAASLAAPAVLVGLRGLDTPVERAVVAVSILIGALTAVERARRAVAEHAANEERLIHVATHDELTDLPNRRQALILLERALDRRRGPVSVLYVDLDRFKLVNDAWGHHVGDELLQSVADRLRNTVEPTAILAHVSGDELLVIAAELDESAGGRLAASVVGAFSTSFQLSIGEIFVTASVGLATAPVHRGEVLAEELVRDADIALRSAKQTGRHRTVRFDAVMRHQVSHRAELERDLRLALERDEFELHYQPIVAVDGGRVLGHEALLRWHRPGHGLVEPQVFMPTLEDIDLIVDVGEQVLARAVRQLAGPSVDRWTYLAVNVAARQVRHPTLAATVGRLLTESGVDPSRLVLELTESLLIEDSPVVRATIQGLAVLGVPLVIDDFGVGHSSLQYLTRFPVSAVKIDRSFVERVTLDKDARAIITAVVGLSRALSLRVVAEGVETVEQRRVLAELGCDAFQGWLGGRPRAAVTSDRQRLHAHDQLPPTPAPLSTPAPPSTSSRLGHT